jgi:hypothetical protein
MYNIQELLQSVTIGLKVNIKNKQALDKRRYININESHEGNSASLFIEE